MPISQLRTFVDGPIPRSVDSRRTTVPEYNPRPLQPAPPNVKSRFKIPLNEDYPSSLNDCLEVLRRAAPLVEYFLMVDVRSKDVDTSVGVPCVQPHLTNLNLIAEYDKHVVCNDSRCPITRLLPLLTLPALQTFQLDQYHESLIGFLQRHSHLQKLAMEYPPVGSIAQVALPHLTHLRMYPSRRPAPTFARDFFALLEHTPFLPALQNIHLPTFYSRERADFERIGRALLARWYRSDVAAISSLRLDIGLDEGETLDDFKSALRPLTGLSAKGVGTRVEIGTCA